jgi:hypothetical protein
LGGGAAAAIDRNTLFGRRAKVPAAVGQNLVRKP